ncbi:hypothetical protein OG225_16165 [Nocardia sp. NBC_01377]|uniref:WD40 repeat domain-containing protein n=1 Tax=Nocardia sp. NBC_01377 TaxID=2903595 RepID=UPI003256189C
MDTNPTESRWQPSPRAVFSRQFAALFEAAGNPTLRRVAAATEARMRGARATAQKGAVSVQWISDWKGGRNVPARFESLVPVLLTLIGEARKSSGPVPPALLDMQEWKRLWTASNDWDPDSEISECPYLGLTSYRRRDAELFFGRSRPTGVVRVWSLPESVLPDHAEWIYAPVFDAARRRMVAITEDALEIWDTSETLGIRRVGRLDMRPGRSNAPALSPDGRTVAFVDDRITSVSFSADGRMLATAERDFVRLWDFSDPAAPVAIRHAIVRYPDFEGRTSATFHGTTTCSESARAPRHTTGTWTPRP